MVNMVLNMSDGLSFKILSTETSGSPRPTVSRDVKGLNTKIIAAYFHKKLDSWHKGCSAFSMSS